MHSWDCHTCGTYTRSIVVDGSFNIGLLCRQQISVSASLAYRLKHEFHYFD